ncbi:MAG: copper ion binding protein, partial [Halobaculum sp.]
MADLTIDVQGMSCANCSTTIETQVEGVEGVSSVSANFATDEARVSYDGDATTLSAVIEAIRDAGYDPVTSEVTVGITDMTCANCSQTVESAVSKLPGVV